MIQVDLSPESVDICRQRVAENPHVKAVMASKVAMAKDRDLIGEMGELAVEYYLQSLDIQCERPPIVHKFGVGGDKYDIKLWPSGLTIDVKSTVKYNTIKMNNKQYWKTIYKKINLLVGTKVYLDQNRVLIWGYCKPSALVRDTFSDFMYQGQQFQMYSVPFEKIIPFKIDNISLYA